MVRDANLKQHLAIDAGHQPFIVDAPVLIVVCADLDHIERSYGERGRYTYALQDTATAMQNMMLAITAFGLGCCWIGAFLEEKAAKILNLPKGIRPVAMLPIGVPAEKPKAPPRRAIDEVTTFR